MQCFKDILKMHLYIKKIFSEPSGKGHTFPGKNVAGKVFLSKYEMPISFQATMATFQDNFLKMP